MDFSSDILITSGLNLAGYLLVAVLVLLLVKNRSAKRVDSNMAADTPAPRVRAYQPVETPAAARDIDARFIPLPKHPIEPDETPDTAMAASVADTDTPDMAFAEVPVSAVGEQRSRQANRRAIYCQARKMLAEGRSSRELRSKLPLTEDEVDMLSLAGSR